MNTSTYVTPSQTSPQPPASRPWTAGRVTALVLGILLLLASFGIGVFGAALAVADNGLRDDDGFLMSADETFSTASYAMISENVEIHADGGAEYLPSRLLGDAKVTAAPNGDVAVFVGVAPTADVEAYLEGVGHSTFVGFDQTDPQYTTNDGGAPATPPTESDIWVSESSGSGTQSVEWELESGDWTVVVMNADGSRGVSADLAVGATVPALGWVVALTLSMAAVTFIVAVILTVVGLRRP